MELLINAALGGGTAFLLSYVFVPATNKISHVIGAIDLPDGKRKINTVPMPRLGGLGFFYAFFIAALIFIGIKSPYVTAILIGGAVIVAAGVTDDARGIRWGEKLFLQIAVSLIALLIIPLPEEFSVFGLLTVPLALPLGFLVPLFRIVFTCNAVNFADGLDGLATGLSSVALVSICVLAYKNGNATVSTAALLLAAATLGFLPYNRHHAKIFMGDCGSQFLGFSIAILSLGSSKGGDFAAETSLFLFIPTLDVWVSVLRRIFSGENPFRADKGHLHHTLLRHGVSHDGAVRLLVSISALVAALTLKFALQS